ncbi:flagellar protein FlaG [Pseudomonas sp. LFM046]|uniref:flagellar protein FlaG n=1 Tax=Pseudomonas sp. LFM046 TaxID=1608357 RepID=UPI0005CFEDD1|nr:flagellar protein FlaG [Pseudomonas sp. LFM046]
MEIGIVNLSAKGMTTSLGVDGQARGTALKAASDKVAEQAQQKVESETADREPLEAAASSIQEFVQSIRRNLNFNVDDSSGRVVVQVTDSESGEVIRQIPSEDALKLAESLSEMRSLLFKAEA